MFSMLAAHTIDPLFELKLPEKLPSQCLIVRSLLKKGMCIDELKFACASYYLKPMERKSVLTLFSIINQFNQNQSQYWKMPKSVRKKIFESITNSMTLSELAKILVALTDKAYVKLIASTEHPSLMVHQNETDSSYLNCAIF